MSEHVANYKENCIKGEKNCKKFKQFSSLKKKVFSETGKKSFLGAKFLSKEKGRLARKINITFFIGNEVLNIFSSNTFFEKKQHFPRNSKKIF